MPLAVAERTEFLNLLEALTTEQWNAPTLCAEWSVREVVAHVLSYEDLSGLQTAGLFLRGRLSITRINDLALAPFRASEPEELADRMRTHLTPTGLTAGSMGGIALTDGMIHQQDIRRPLGIERAIPPDRLRAALTIAVKAPTLPSRRSVKRARLVATDIDWSNGQGPEIRGPAEALLMLIAGRRSVIADCSGPGLQHLGS